MRSVDNSEVPARIVAGRQVEELVLVEPEGRAAIPIAQRPHGEEPDEQHRQPRREPEGQEVRTPPRPANGQCSSTPAVNRLVPPNSVANEYDGQRQQEDRAPKVMDTRLPKTWRRNPAKPATMTARPATASASVSAARTQAGSAAGVGSEAVGVASEV